MSDDRLRLDKWLWFARFFKSRSLATRFCSEGRMRVNGQVVAKAHHRVRPGDVLTFALGPRVRVVEVVALGRRRGPAEEAHALYRDVETSPCGGAARVAVAVREPGAGRPTKRDRRAIERLTKPERD